MLRVEVLPCLALVCQLACAPLAAVPVIGRGSGRRADLAHQRGDHVCSDSTSGSCTPYCSGEDLAAQSCTVSTGGSIVCSNAAWNPWNREGCAIGGSGVVCNRP